MLVVARSDMVVVAGRASAMAVRPAAGGFDYRIIGRVFSAAHAAVGQAGIQRQSFAAMTDHTAEGFNRVRFTDFRQPGVAGQAIFNLTGQGGRQGDWLDATTLQPGNSKQGQQ